MMLTLRVLFVIYVDDLLAIRDCANYAYRDGFGLSLACLIFQWIMLGKEAKD
ncbi:hypothetical protein [Photorhabdus caribbeanensis]|uniref:hypothetical protein n=1 Tax=Photorhabdus caribbeanensis TaxID=1004165 RepID=UPI001BD49375|nr:hypothetical protein [Photorhabdus caribbeanensis]